VQTLQSEATTLSAQIMVLQVQNRETVLLKATTVFFFVFLIGKMTICITLHGYQILLYKVTLKIQ